MPTITAIPAFTDNYIWLLAEQGHAWVVDPGDAAPVEAALHAQSLTLAGILLTHHHPDHVAGVPALVKQRAIPVWGPAREPVPGMTQPVDEGDSIAPEGLGLRFEVFAVPGHTKGHVALHAPGMLFCGDTFFSAGCGRLFEGTPQQMSTSLNRLAALPDDTQVYCGHEYTLANLAFAAAVEPENPAVATRRAQAQAARGRGQPSLPARMDEERGYNPFLRCAVPAVRAAAERQAGKPLADEIEVFAALRRWKDGFRAA